MVKFFVVEPTHPGLNPRFNVGVVNLWLIILSVIDDVSVDSETFFDRLCKSQDQSGPVFLEVLIGVGCAYVYSKG
jgi:hypothetical protein